MPPVYDVRGMTLEEQVGQMIMVRYPDQDLLREMLVNGWGGSFYFGMKGQSAEEVAETLNDLQRISKVPALVAFGFACVTCGTGLLQGNLMRVGATRDPALAYRLAWLETLEQRAYGFHIPGMPCLDVNTNPANPIINTRAISDDPDLVTEIGLEILRAQMDARALTCVMHFPGHGDTAEDSHIRMPTVNRSAEELWAVDLAPYRAAISQGLINGICTNHNFYPAYQEGPPAPATISRRLITDLLRGELGYDGITMTDSLTMKPMKDAYGIEEAAILSVQAGHDIILQDYQSDPRITHRALVAAVQSGRIPAAQVEASAARIMGLKQWLGLLDNPFVDLERIPERVATPELKAFALEVAQRAVTVLEDAALPLRVSTPEKCLVIANGRQTLFDADMGLEHLPNFERFYRAMQQRLPGVPTCTIGEAMPPEDLARAREMAGEAEVIVVGLFTRVLCYHEDSIGVAAPFRQLIADLVVTGKPVILCNFGNPYIMADLPRGAGALCTYDEECPESMEAAVQVLCGEVRSTGKLPVRVSDAYPFGHGR
jgi:beta-N-acetylhexosaminidase